MPAIFPATRKRASGGMVCSGLALSRMPYATRENALPPGGLPALMVPRLRDSSCGRSVAAATDDS